MFLPECAVVTVNPWHRECHSPVGIDDVVKIESSDLCSRVSLHFLTVWNLEQRNVARAVPVLSLVNERIIDIKFESRLDGVTLSLPV